MSAGIRGIQRVTRPRAIRPDLWVPRRGEIYARELGHADITPTIGKGGFVLWTMPAGFIDRFYVYAGGTNAATVVRLALYLDDYGLPGNLYYSAPALVGVTLGMNPIIVALTIPEPMDIWVYSRHDVSNPTNFQGYGGAPSRGAPLLNANLAIGSGWGENTAWTGEPPPRARTDDLVPVNSIIKVGFRYA